MLLVGIVLIGGGGGAATACKLWLNCHTHATPALVNEIQNYQGKSSGIKVDRPDLAVVTVAKGFTYPTDFAFLDDSHILVAERDGRILSVTTAGVVSPTPVLDLRPRIDERYFRGVLGFAIDPDFKAHPYIYVVYTPRMGGAKAVSTIVRVSRFTMVGGRADPRSERVIVGKDDSRPCEAQPTSADCLPSSLDVDGSDIAFGSDGTLFISTGFGGGLEHVEHSATLAQDVNTLGGKLLHIDRDGRGLPDNPFWNGDPSANRSKVWAVGFRNPFRFGQVKSDPLTFLVGNVGWDWRESIYRVTRGGDYGWPCYEGLMRTPEYNVTAFCREYYRANPKPPTGVWLQISHPKAITMVAGPALEQATKLPADLRGDFLFADWGRGDISVASPERGEHASTVTRIAHNAGGPDRFRVGPDGALYYLAANSGELRRVSQK
ncbi:MAG TPA: PQQ-dependent sugar dehydrogenase [Gaiellaceae bacterium]|nr:PQQ-dependent sugar dehydrogenase [Gaiellaceae bacterium]